MKLKILKWIALLVGSGLCIPIIGSIIFAGAYYIEGLTNDTPLVAYDPIFAWMQIAVLPVGPLLLFYVYYNERLLSKDENTN